MKVAAAVLTYNRPVQLEQCLEGLLEQTRPLDKIIIIDNHSDDDTRKTLAARGYLTHPKISYNKLAVNVGSAGGFAAALKMGIEENVDWVWTMDDDAVPEPNAMAELLEGLKKARALYDPAIVASTVIWKDGLLHPMNAPHVRMADAEAMVQCAKMGLVALRSISWTGMMICRRAILANEPPLADYHIWGDDTEFTGRVLRDEIGILCPFSRILHQTKSKHTPVSDTTGRFYYEVRNHLWLIVHSSGWTLTEKLKFAGRLAIAIKSNIDQSQNKLRSLTTVFRGLWHGIARRPRSEQTQTR